MIYTGISFLIDVNNTLFNTYPTVLSVYNDIHNTNLTPDTCTSFDLSVAFGKTQAAQLGNLLNVFTLYSCMKADEVLLSEMHNLYCMGISTQFLISKDLPREVRLELARIIRKKMKSLGIPCTILHTVPKGHTDFVFTANPSVATCANYSTLIVPTIPWLNEFKKDTYVLYDKSIRLVDLVFRNLSLQG